jgi:phage terminase large subunit-like protein
MVGSIVHQLVKSVVEPNETAPDWIGQENFSVHYHEPIITRPDGTERSCWPARWSLDFLESIRHTRQYQKNYRNLPAGTGDYWAPEDLEQARERGRTVVGITKAVLSIDPATTSKLTSDRTAFAVVSVSPSARTAIVEATRAVVLPPARCRELALGFLEDHPEIRLIVIESNQGGETWHSVYHHMPVPVVLETQSEPKPVRAARLLNHFQRRRAALRGRQPAFEEEALSFPRGAHDDVLDAVGTGVDYVLKTRRRQQRSQQQDYVA